MGEISFKCCYGDVVRRVTMVRTKTLSEFVEELRKIFEIPVGNFRLTYRDPEGDVITLANDSDLEEALRLMGDKQLHVFIGEVTPSGTGEGPCCTLPEIVQHVAAHAKAFHDMLAYGKGSPNGDWVKNLAQLHEFIGPLIAHVHRICRDSHGEFGRWGMGPHGELGPCEMGPCGGFGPWGHPYPCGMGRHEGMSPCGGFGPSGHPHPCGMGRHDGMGPHGPCHGPGGMGPHGPCHGPGGMSPHGPCHGPGGMSPRGPCHGFGGMGRRHGMGPCGGMSPHGPCHGFGGMGRRHGMGPCGGMCGPEMFHGCAQFAGPYSGFGSCCDGVDLSVVHCHLVKLFRIVHEVIRAFCKKECCTNPKECCTTPKECCTDSAKACCEDGYGICCTEKDEDCECCKPDEKDEKMA